MRIEVVADNYRDQQAEGLITMTRLREKLDGLAEERDALEQRLAMVKGGETRLRELDALPGLVEEYLRDLPYLVGRESVVREYETVPAERTLEKPIGAYTLTPERARDLSEEELAKKRLDAEAARAARFQAVYAMIGLQVAVHSSGALDISLGANAESSFAANAGSETKGVMPWGESG